MIREQKLALSIAVALSRLERNGEKSSPRPVFLTEVNDQRVFCFAKLLIDQLVNIRGFVDQTHEPLTLLLKSDDEESRVRLMAQKSDGKIKSLTPAWGHESLQKRFPEEWGALKEVVDAINQALITI